MTVFGASRVLSSRFFFFFIHKRIWMLVHANAPDPSGSGGKRTVPSISYK